MSPEWFEYLLSLIVPENQRFDILIREATQIDNILVTNLSRRGGGDFLESIKEDN